MKNIVHESYTDIMKNTGLSQLVFVMQDSKQESTKLNLRRLEGVGPNQMRVPGLEGIKDPVDLE